MPIPSIRRARLRRLVADHVRSLNAHDLETSMAAFASHASLRINGNFSGTLKSIAAEYTRLGFSTEPGLFTLQLVLQGEHFTEEELVYEARLRGEHSGSAPGFPAPTGAALEIACVLMYRFDPHDRVIAKHAAIDFGPLFRGLYPAPPLAQPSDASAGVP